MPRSLRRVVMVMTDLPKTREYELFRNRAKYTTQIAGHLIVRQDKADAMRDELLGRIAELEEDNPRLMPVGDFANNFDPNPMVVLHGRGPEEARCKTCRHVVQTCPTGHRTYWKCNRRRISRSAQSDHRLKWNACRLYEEGSKDE